MKSTILILALAQAATSPNFPNESEMISRAKKAVEIIAVQVMQFEQISGRLPTEEEGLSVLVTRPGNVKKWTQLMSLVPNDPWQHPYILTKDGDSVWGFYVTSKGSNIESPEDDISYPAPKKTEQGAAANP